MNALTLTILLHHYWSPEDYRACSNAAPSFSHAEELGIKLLLDNDLIQASVKQMVVYEITQKGNCHIEAILNASLPSNNWVSSIK